MENMEIRTRSKNAGIKLWEIAYALGITDATFSRKLRLELPDLERERILIIIDEISQRKKNRTA